MSIAARPLTAHFGLEILGLDLSSTITDTDRQAVLDAWVAGGIVLVRGCDSSEKHLRLSECFGTLEVSATPDLNLESSPYLMEMKYDPAKPRGAGTLVRLNGEERAGWLGWHWDQSFMPLIVRGAALRMIEPAAVAGETGFIDAIDAWQRLSPEMQRRIDGLEVVYEFTGEMEKNPFGFPKDLQNLRTEAENAALRERYTFAPVVHPLVITQQETGRKVLKLSPMHAKRVLGLPETESHALLTELADHLTDPAYAYHHRWSPDEVIVWDNWRVIHSAAGVPFDVPRRAQRTTLVGDYGYGRYLDSSMDRERIGQRLAD